MENCYQSKSSFFTISLGRIRRYLVRGVGEQGRRFGNFQNVGVHSSLSKTHTTTVITIIWDLRGTESTGGGSWVGTKFQFRGRSYYSILRCSGEGGVGPHSRAITSASLLHLLLSLWLSSTAPRNIIIVITRNASFHLNYTLTTSTRLCWMLQISLPGHHSQKCTPTKRELRSNSERAIRIQNWHNCHA